MQEPSLLCLLGLPAEKHPAWSQIFYQKEWSGSGCLIVPHSCLPANPGQQMSFQTTADLNPLSNYSRRAGGGSLGNSDWANKEWHHWHDYGNILEMVCGLICKANYEHQSTWDCTPHIYTFGKTFTWYKQHKSTIPIIQLPYNNSIV